MVTVGDPVLSHFAFTTISNPQTAGIPFTVTITAVLSDGNTATDFTGMVSLTGIASDGSPGIPIDHDAVTILAGEATVNVSVGAPAVGMKLKVATN